MQERSDSPSSVVTIRCRVRLRAANKLPELIAEPGRGTKLAQDPLFHILPVLPPLARHAATHRPNPVSFLRRRAGPETDSIPESLLLSRFVSCRIHVVGQEHLNPEHLNPGAQTCRRIVASRVSRSGCAGPSNARSGRASVVVSSFPAPVSDLDRSRASGVGRLIASLRLPGLHRLFVPDPCCLLLLRCAPTPGEQRPSCLLPGVQERRPRGILDMLGGHRFPLSIRTAIAFISLDLLSV